MTVRSPDNEIILEGQGHNKVYEVTVLESGETIANYSQYCDRPTDTITWHRRLGHVSIQCILQMSN